MNEELEQIVSYQAARRCPATWKVFFDALATEFSQNLSVQDLRQLMHRIGARMAASAKLPNCRTVEALQASLNARFRELEWGWCRIEESERALWVTHYCFPFTAAFDAAAWAPALLEGAYQEWFKALGADNALRVSQRIGDATAQGGRVLKMEKLEFRLSR